MGKSNNVATFHLAPGYKGFKAFCAKAEIDYESEQIQPICMPAHIIPPDDEPEDETPTQWEENQEDEPIPVNTNFELNGPKGVVSPVNLIPDDEEQRVGDTDSAVLLSYHHRFGLFHSQSCSKWQGWESYQDDWLIAKFHRVLHVCMRRRQRNHGDQRVGRIGSQRKPQLYPVKEYRWTK